MKSIHPQLPRSKPAECSVGKSGLRCSRSSLARNLLANRDGVTLLELMIVGAIIAMLAAMVAPNIMSIHRESWLAEETDKVRDLMSLARTHAIDQGIDYEFRYEIGGPMAIVIPSELEENTSEATSQTGSTALTAEYPRALIELHEELQIRTPEGVEENSESLSREQFGSLTGSQLEDKTWSTAVRFRYDGTSEDFELRVFDDEELTCNVTLRGLTGSVRTTQVYDGSEN